MSGDADAAVAGAGTCCRDRDWCRRRRCRSRCRCRSCTACCRCRCRRSRGGRPSRSGGASDVSAMSSSTTPLPPTPRSSHAPPTQCPGLSAVAQPIAKTQSPQARPPARASWRAAYICLQSMVRPILDQITFGAWLADSREPRRPRFGRVAHRRVLAVAHDRRLQQQRILEQRLLQERPGEGSRRGAPCRESAATRGRRACRARRAQRRSGALRQRAPSPSDRRAGF